MEYIALTASRSGSNDYPNESWMEFCSGHDSGSPGGHLSDFMRIVTVSHHASTQSSMSLLFEIFRRPMIDSSLLKSLADSVTGRDIDQILQDI